MLRAGWRLFVPESGQVASVLNSDDEWMQSVRSGRFWRGGPGNAAAPLGSPSPSDEFRSPLGVSRPEPEQANGSGTYRTVCVRLCDGYAWPVSFSTTSSRFASDQEVCKQSCSTPAKLFTHRNPGGGMEDMVDLSGRPYSALPTAFFYQAIYDESCKCRSHPWEQESRDRHRIYALEARVRKGDKLARAELRRLKSSSAAAGTEAVAAQRRGKRKARRRR